MEVLADVLRVIRLTGGVFLQADFTAPWCLSGKISPDDCRAFMRPPSDVMALHFVVTGRMQLRVAAGEPVEVAAGEVVLLPHNDQHLFGSSLDVPPGRAGGVVQPPPGGGPGRVSYGGGGAETQLLCGYVGCDAPFRPLLQALPPVLKLAVGSTRSGDWIEASFRLATSKSATSRPGSGRAVAPLAELLVSEAVEQYVGALPADRGGWLAGLRDTWVGRALSLLHANPHDDWTAESLAKQVGLSRSAFADRFTTLVGQPPMQYLAQWRMHLAAQRLRETSASVAQVGHAVGYESEAAFSRAFKRQFGQSPATWRTMDA